MLRPRDHANSGSAPSSERSEDQLDRVRHSLAHVLAMAVLELRPGAELGFGSAVEDGFCYDFVLPVPLGEHDFGELERRMRRIIDRRIPFEHEELPVEVAIERLANDPGQRRKADHRRELSESPDLDRPSICRTDTFLDLCRGLHVAHTGELPADAFSLRSVAGAYWLGDSRGEMMTRIHGWAFASREELDAHIEARARALERDHRKLGRELDIFVIDDVVGPGLPLWLPNGTVLRDELEKLAKELETTATRTPAPCPGCCACAG